MSNKNLLYCIISGEDTYYNYERSILMKKDPAYWGFAESKLFPKLGIGDVIIFSNSRKVEYLGIVTDAYLDPEKGNELGWRQGDKLYDQIVELRKVKVPISDITYYITWKKGPPRGPAFIPSKRLNGFWKTFGSIINDEGVECVEKEEIKLEENPAISYIIGYEGEAPVRIGESDKSDKRLDSHDKATWKNLVVYHCEVSPTGNGRDLEKRVHKRLIEDRIFKNHWNTGKRTGTSWYNTLPERAIQVMKEEAETLKTIQECR